MVLVGDRRAQNGLVFAVTAVGICSLPRVEKDKLAQGLSSTSPARHPSKYNKPLMELNSFNSKEAGTPRPNLQRQSCQVMCAIKLVFLLPQREASHLDGQPCFFRKHRGHTGSQTRDSVHLPALYLGSCALFCLFSLL